MNIFLSWSGDRSKCIAEVLKKWLPYFLQAVKPWMSSSDIDKGTRWSSDIASKLGECTMGIICLTPENVEAPWILFEAGALSKTLDTAHVCPLLFDIEPSGLKGPLVQFQATKLIGEDFKKLIHTINKCLQDRVSDLQIEESFNAWWPKVDSELKVLSQSKKEAAPKRKDREILEEILELVRQQTRHNDPLGIRKDVILDILSRPLRNEARTEGPTKTRVYELADKMSIDSKELMARLQAIGVPIKNHMAVIDEEDVFKLMTEG